MSELATIARPYARAIFESALQKKTLKMWLEVLKKLAAVASNKTMQPVLANPFVSRKQLTDLFLGIVGNPIDEEAKNLVNLLAENKRLNLLPAILKLFEALVAEQEKTIEVKVVSAFPIDQERLQRLAHALQNNLKRQVTIRCVIDRTILGGAIIRVGDEVNQSLVIDGSLTSKLKRLSERLCS